MKKNKKGMTIVETIVSLVIISLAVTVGMVAMSASAKYLNSGATLKHQREDYAVESTANEEEQSVVIHINMDGTERAVQLPVTKQTFDDNNFVNYAAEESSTP